MYAPRGNTTDDIANILSRGDALVASEGAAWREDTAQKLAARYVRRRLADADDMLMILDMIGLPQTVEFVTDEEQKLWRRGSAPDPGVPEH